MYVSVTSLVFLYANIIDLFCSIFEDEKIIVHCVLNFLSGKKKSVSDLRRIPKRLAVRVWEIEGLNV